MKTVIATLKGISPYQQGKYYETPKLEKEGNDEYEKRTWRDKTHVDNKGYIFIPPMAFKKCLEKAAAFLSISIPGKGKSLYTKHFLSGILVTEGLSLKVKKDDVAGIWILGNSRGQRGSAGPRVKKCFPTIQEWEGDVTFYILDETITKDVFETVLKEAGNFIGVGVFRPENGGYHGRFVVENLEWS